MSKANVKSSGEILREARSKTGMSQGELAKKMGYSNPQFVSNWERGLCCLPAKKAALFCRLTGMSSEVMRFILKKEAQAKVDRRFNAKVGMEAKAKK